MKMKKIPDFIPAPTSPDHVPVDAVILWCLDPRFENARQKFLEEMGFAHADPYTIPGGVRDLASPNGTRGLVIDRIKTLAERHHAPRVILMAHEDCAMYGGTAAFGGSEHERPELVRELRIGRDALKSALSPDVPVELVYFDLAGIHHILE